MKTKVKILLLVLVFAAAACNKDDDKNDLQNPVATMGAYTYQGAPYAIIDAEYLVADGDTFLFLRGTGQVSYIQVIFPDRTEIPTGELTYNGLRYGPTYNPAIHFSGGSVSNEINALGWNLSGGDISITKDGDVYTMNFGLNTAEGAASGTFTGTIRPR